MNATISELLKKYDVPGPRYTSYPTILDWDADPTVEQWIASISESLDLTERHGAGRCDLRPHPLLPFALYLLRMQFANHLQYLGGAALYSNRLAGMGTVSSTTWSRAADSTC